MREIHLGCLEAAPQIPRRSALSTVAGKGVPANERFAVSYRTQATDSCRYELPQGRQFRAQNTRALRGNTVRLPAIFRRQRLNQALFLEARDRAIKGPRPQPRPA